MSRGPGCSSQRLGGLRGGLGGVFSALFVGADDRPAGGDQAAGGVRLEGGPEVLCAAALGADAGEQEDRPRHEGAEALEEVWAGGAGHGSYRREPAGAYVLGAHLVDDAGELVVEWFLLRLV